MKDVEAAIKFAEELNISPRSCVSITSSTATTVYNTFQDSPDWYYAVGGYKAWGKATVALDINGYVSMRYAYRVFDRYNWDNGKSVSIGALTITDESMGELHRAGIAQEFNLIGTIERTYTWKKGLPPYKSSGWPP